MMPLPNPVIACAVLPSSSPAAPGTLMPNNDVCCATRGAPRQRAARRASGAALARILHRAWGLRVACPGAACRAARGGSGRGASTHLALKGARRGHPLIRRRARRGGARGMWRRARVVQRAAPVQPRRRRAVARRRRLRRVGSVRVRHRRPGRRPRRSIGRDTFSRRSGQQRRRVLLVRRRHRGAPGARRAADADRERCAVCRTPYGDRPGETKRHRKRRTRRTRRRR